MADDLRLEAVKSALEWSKQILTLATGTLVLSGTFVTDIFKNSIKGTGWILACWILMCVSILVGLLFLGVLTSLLNKNNPAKLNVYAKKSISLLHIGAFMAGLVCLVVFVTLNLGNINAPAPAPCPPGAERLAPRAQ